MAPKRNGRRLVLEVVTWPLKSIYSITAGAERSGAGRRAPHDQPWEDFGLILHALAPIGCPHSSAQTAAQSYSCRGA